MYKPSSHTCGGSRGFLTTGMASVRFLTGELIYWNFEGVMSLIAWPTLAEESEHIWGSWGLLRFGKVREDSWLVRENSSKRQRFYSGSNCSTGGFLEVHDRARFLRVPEDCWLWRDQEPSRGWKPQDLDPWTTLTEWGLLGTAEVQGGSWLGSRLAAK